MLSEHVVAHDAVLDGDVCGGVVDASGMGRCTGRLAAKLQAVRSVVK